MIRWVGLKRGDININAFGVRCSSMARMPRGKKDTTTFKNSPFKQHPLAVMPTSMLLRSLFITTVSSNKFLLTLSLHLLSFLAKPNRGLLFNVDRNLVLKGILKQTLYKQFCAGETEQETRACVRKLKDLGFKAVILTFAKETVFDYRSKSPDLHSPEKAVETATTHDVDIETWRIGTLKTVDMISKGDILAIKTTGGGLMVTETLSRGELPPQQMLDALDEVAIK